MQLVRHTLLLCAALFSCPVLCESVETQILVHSGLTAGLRYHDAKAVWNRLRVGDYVALVREPTNPVDGNAVRVDWEGYTLGYLPRADNAAIARQLDRGAALQARITQLAKHRNHRLKLGIDIFLKM
ncbi:MAG TPA: HIRAN domain-containing protein [Burkholderiales bacterium]|nr:HIRAN domain-containing protein [Burkholderiales bacterium]